MTLSGNTPDCISWRERIYSRHTGISGFLKQRHAAKVKKNGYVQANHWLREFEQSLKIAHSGLFCDCGDQEIKDYSAAKSKKTYAQIIEAANTIGVEDEKPKNKIVEYIRVQVEKAGVHFPLSADNYTSKERIEALARVCDERWWRSQLRKVSAQQYERIAREQGLVNLQKEIYCSDFTLNRRNEQKRRNRRLLESLEAENDEGQTFSLSDLADMSVSNPVIRRHELMCRIKGFEEYAKSHHHKNKTSGKPVSYTGVFLTLTAPSKYHAVITRKTPNNKRFTVFNRRFNGADPKQTNDFLCGIWAAIRSEWSRRDIHPFGFRMVEPHHDGTPHWHLILFLPSDRLIEASYVFWKYALREDGDEPGALQARTRIVYIDPAKGSAAGYCAKYISKNIDGFAVGQDHYGKNAIKSAIRIEAWARTWNIRQFQQIGGASVTVWREARRIDFESLPIELTHQAREVIEAADNGDWESYTDLMGGAICPRKDRPLRPLMIARKTINKYGELTKAIKGILFSGVPLLTRIHRWVVRPITSKKQSNGRDCEETWPSSLKGFYAPPTAA